MIAEKSLDRERHRTTTTTTWSAYQMYLDSPKSGCDAKRGRPETSLGRLFGFDGWL